MRAFLILACSVLAVGWSAPPAWSQQIATTAATQYVEVQGSRIAYRSIGSGNPILLINRFRGTLDTWDPLFLDELASRHRVITVDYPGVGYSSGALPIEMSQVAGFINSFARGIGLQRFAVLGWSWGGLAAQALLLDYPATVSHAILIGTGPPGPDQAAIQPFWLERALAPVNDLDDEEILFFEPRSESSRAAAKASHDRIYARLGVTEKIPATQLEFDAFFSVSGGFIADTLGRREQLTRSPVPMLILSGDNDPSVPATNWYRLMGEIPRAQLIVLPQSGHGPQHQYPELSAQYIGAFLALTTR